MIQKKPPPSRVVKPANVEAAATNDKLEQMLADDPTDRATWQIYADWLLELGEPWGEVIAMAAAGRFPTEKQVETTDKLLRGLDGSSIRWKFGTVDTVSLCPEEGNEDEDEDDDDDDDDDDDEDPNDGEINNKDEDDDERDTDLRAYGRALQRILRHPAGRLTRKLELGLPPGDDHDYGYHSILPALTGSGPLPLLRVLDMSPDAAFMPQPSWRSIGDLGGLWAIAPRLRELHLQGTNTATTFGNIVAPHLETLVHISSGLPESVPIALGKASLPALRRLELYIGRENYGNDCTMQSFAGIFEGKGLPCLEYLGLVNSEWERELIAALATAPIVKRIKRLDLTKGIFFRDAAAALLEHAAAFRHLDFFDLSDNYLEPADCKAIKTAIPCANVGDQKVVEDWDGDLAFRYTTVGE